MSDIWVRNNGIWKVTETVWVRVDNVWKTVSDAWVRQDNQWKHVNIRQLGKGYYAGGQERSIDINDNIDVLKFSNITAINFADEVEYLCSENLHAGISRLASAYSSVKAYFYGGMEWCSEITTNEQDNYWCSNSAYNNDYIDVLFFATETVCPIQVFFSVSNYGIKNQLIDHVGTQSANNGYFTWGRALLSSVIDYCNAAEDGSHYIIPLYKINFNTESQTTVRDDPATLDPSTGNNPILFGSVVNSDEKAYFVSGDPIHGSRAEYGGLPDEMLSGTSDSGFLIFAFDTESISKYPGLDWAHPGMITSQSSSCGYFMGGTQFVSEKTHKLDFSTETFTQIDVLIFRGFCPSTHAGSQSYFLGGKDYNGFTIDDISKFIISSESYVTVKNNIYLGGRVLLAAATYKIPFVEKYPHQGYFAGGTDKDNNNYYTVIESVDFDTETWGSPNSYLLEPAANSSSVNSNAKGYIVAGESISITYFIIQVFEFATEVCSKLADTLEYGTINSAGVNSIDYGYIAGGSQHNTSALQDKIYRLGFYSDELKIISGSLSTLRYSLVGTNSGSAGYFYTGRDDGTLYDKTDKLFFSTEECIDLQITSGWNASYYFGLNSLNSSYYGYTEPSQEVHGIIKFPFSSEEYSEITFELNHADWDKTGINNTDKGFMGGGRTEYNTTSIEINKLLFSNESLTHTGMSLFTGRTGMAGLNKNIHGGIIGLNEQPSPNMYMMGVCHGYTNFMLKFNYYAETHSYGHIRIIDVGGVSSAIDLHISCGNFQYSGWYIINSELKHHIEELFFATETFSVQLYKDNLHRWDYITDSSMTSNEFMYISRNVYNGSGDENDVNNYHEVNVKISYHTKTETTLGYTIGNSGGIPENVYSDTNGYYLRAGSTIKKLIFTDDTITESSSQLNSNGKPVGSSTDHSRAYISRMWCDDNNDSTNNTKVEFDRFNYSDESLTTLTYSFPSNFGSDGYRDSTGNCPGNGTFHYFAFTYQRYSGIDQTYFWKIDKHSDTHMFIDSIENDWVKIRSTSPRFGKI